jgi:cobaltochelatase CobT
MDQVMAIRDGRRGDARVRDMAEVRNKVTDFARSVGADPSAVRWEALYHPLFKEFGERFSLEQKRRFATAYDHTWQGQNLLQNIDGASLLEAAKRVLMRPEKRKLMIVFSDGEPCSNMDNYTLDAHLKKVVPEIEKNGVEVIGVGIQTTSVNRYYKKAFVVNNLQELPAKVMGELKTFLLR